MLLSKFIRKLGKMLRSGAGGREIFLGGFCGVLVGMIPGVNLALVLAIVLMLLLNANVGIALLGIMLGKLVCIAVAPITFHIGYTVIHSIGLEGLFGRLCNTPVLALLDLHRYCLLGGLPAAIILGLVFGKFMAYFIAKLREAAIKAASGDKAQKILQNKLVKFIMWLAFGKAKADMQGTLDKQSPMFRKAGIVLAGSLVVIVAALELLLLNMVVRIGLEKGIAAGTGAQVDVAKARMSLADGKLAIEGLQVTDAAQPTHNLVQVARLEADVSMSDLLRRSYAIDLLAGSDVQMRAKREKPGEVYVTPDEAEPEAGTQAEGDSLDKYFGKAKEWRRHLGKVKEYLAKRKAAEADKEAAGEQARQQKQDVVGQARGMGYLNLSARDLLTSRPTWLIRKVVLDQVVVAPGTPAQKLEGEDISSHPELTQAPMRLRLTPAAGGDPTATLLLHFEKPDLPHDIALNLAGIKLGESLGLSGGLPLNIQDGQADARADGTFSVEKLHVPFNITVKDLKANAAEGTPVLGMDPATAREVFKSLEELTIVGSLEGSLTSPRVKIDHDKLIGSLKDALMKAGKTALLNRANAELDKVKGQAGEALKDALGDKVPDDLKKSITEKLPGGLGDKLPFGGKKPSGAASEDKADEKTEDPKKKAARALKKLF